MIDHRLDVVIDDAAYTESPRWHDGSFWFADIGRGHVRRLGLDGATTVVELPTASGLGWTTSGELLIASIATSTIFKVGADGVATPLCGPEDHGTRGTNDMATVGSRSYVTAAGRDLGPDDTMEQIAQPVGRILLIDHDSGAGTTVADGLRMPNGVAVTPDGRTLVVNELFEQQILAFDILPDGTLGESSVVVRLDYGIDGLALDAEGGMWVGGTTAEAFERIGPAGTVTDRVDVRGWTCIAPMLGGPDGGTLYMAVNQFEEPAAIFDGRSKGRIVSTRVAVPAAPGPRG